MFEKKALAVAVFESHSQAEDMILKLKHSGFDVTKISIISRDYQTEEHVVGFSITGDRIKFWTRTGAFWGLVIGAGFFMITARGPIVIGELLFKIASGAVAGAAIIGSFSALAAGFYSLWIRNNEVLRYKTERTAKKFFMIANGSDDDVKTAKRILEDSGITTIDSEAKAKKKKPESIDALQYESSVWKRPF